MSKYVDLRCGRRITLAEANLILSLLQQSEGKVAARAAAKIGEAVMLAGHEHFYGPDKRCVTCGEPKGFKRYAPKRPTHRLKLVGKPTLHPPEPA